MVTAKLIIYTLLLIYYIISLIQKNTFKVGTVHLLFIKYSVSVYNMNILFYTAYLLNYTAKYLASTVNRLPYYKDPLEVSSTSIFNIFLCSAVYCKL